MCEGCFWNWPVIRAGNETWHRVCGSDTLVRCGPGSEDQPRAQILSPYPREPMLRRDNGYYAWGDFVNRPPHVGPRPSAAKALLRTSDRAVIFGRRPKVRQRRIIGLEELIERVSHDWISPKAADRAFRKPSDDGPRSVQHGTSWGWRWRAYPATRLAVATNGRGGSTSCCWG